MAFGIAALVAGVLGWLRTRASSPILVVLSTLVFLYSVAYVLMGGFEDTGSAYGLCVAMAFVLASATVALRRRFRRGSS
jgi:hypothetical protein